MSIRYVPPSPSWTDMIEQEGVWVPASAPQPQPRRKPKPVRKRKEVGKRAEHVLLNDQKLRSLRDEPDSLLYYDKVLPDLVMRNGKTQTWGMKKRRPGRKNPTWIPLGNVYVPAEGEKVDHTIMSGALTVVAAREKCRRWLDMLDRNIDPSAEVKRIRTENAQRYTVEQLVDEYFERHWKAKKLAKADEAKRLLRREFAVLLPLPADQITAADVDDAIQVMVARGARSQARNAFAYLRGLYNWAISIPRYRLKTSPCQGLKPNTLVGEEKKSRSRSLSDDELRQVWEGAGQIGGSAGAVIRLLCLTPQRVNEWAGMPWSEIDLDKGEVVIRKDRKGVKNKVDVLVPICPKVRAILESMPRWSRGPHVFSTTGGAKQVTVETFVKQKLDAILRWPVELDDDGNDRNAWVWHDLRRSVRSNLSKLRIDLEVREALMGHVKTGLIKTYDRYDLADEKRAALMEWEARLMTIVDPSPPNVEDLAQARSRRAG